MNMYIKEIRQIQKLIKRIDKNITQRNLSDKITNGVTCRQIKQKRVEKTLSRDLVAVMAG